MSSMTFPAEVRRVMEAADALARFNASERITRECGFEHSYTTRSGATRASDAATIVAHLDDHGELPPQGVGEHLRWFVRCAAISLRGSRLRRSQGEGVR